LSERIQLVSLVVFILCLIGCLITWIIKDFSEKSTEVVGVVASSGKMFIGVTVAYLAAALKSS
jgi:hypothetical protein